MSKRGLFVGLATLDFIYLAEHPPLSNQKVVALDSTIAAGGPATNAAVTFSYLGNQSTLLTALGNHPIGNFIHSDLSSYNVAIADLTPDLTTSPPVSSIVITQSTGERAVISVNATKSQLVETQISDQILQNIDVVLIDGHQMATSVAIAHAAKLAHIPVVVDAGSWKLGFEQVLSAANYVICSANFCPPHCRHADEVFTYLTKLGIPNIAITNNSAPIDYLAKGVKGQIGVPNVQPVDTLGAGDILHGAFCHYILHTEFLDALTQSAEVASRSCQFFGTRQWMRSHNC